MHITKIITKIGISSQVLLWKSGSLGSLLTLEMKLAAELHAGAIE
jgi:hypothetical protein